MKELQNAESTVPRAAAHTVSREANMAGFRRTGKGYHVHIRAWCFTIRLLVDGPILKCSRKSKVLESIM